MKAWAITTDGLGRTYRIPRQGQKDPRQPGTFVALDDVSLQVAPGELFGLLGSNGAGKTTLIKILTTLLAPSSGSAYVGGLDVVSQAAAVREQINMVSGGETSGYGILTVRENLWLFSQLYGVPSKVARRRIDRLLAAVGLADRANTRISRLSTGQRQKMNFCRGFVTDPRILFLDEPTLGLDVQAARTIRDYVRDWMAEKPGRTVVLTTHYLHEADELSNRVAVMHAGRVVACDTPESLKRQVQRFPTFELGLAAGADGWHDLGAVPGVYQFTVERGPTNVDVRVVLREEAAVGSVVRKVVDGGSRILSLKKVEPTLEDAFLELVRTPTAEVAR